MALRDIISTEEAPAAIGPYSQAVKVGQMVFVSGQIGIDPKTGGLEKNNVAEQAKQALLNVKSILKEVNSSFDDVVKATIFLKNMDDFDTVNQIYSSFFKNDYPARCCIEVKGLPADADVEIEVISVID